MRIIGILIAVTILAFLLVWWINLSISSTRKVVVTSQSLDAGQQTQNIEGTGPIDYSKEKAEEINKLNEERAKELETFPEQ